MTAASTQTTSVAAAHRDARSTRRRVRMSALAAAAAIALTAACSDSNIPFYTAPVGVANTQGGVQNAITGLFAASRVDVGTYVYWTTMFARDEGNIFLDNPQNIQFGTGKAPIPNGGPGVWDNQYVGVGAAIAIIDALPTIQPAYTAQQAAAIAGVAQTIEALDLMVVAELRDTLGIPVHTAKSGGVGPVLCNKDVWQSIVALLDSGNNNLNTAQGIALPVKLPPGFASVSLTAGPSTAAGSFASFNRALAGKAGLEYAYAIARNSGGTTPTPTTSGSPDAGALARADSAIQASALLTAALTPPAPGGFTANPSGVFWDFSSQSGDLVNPLNAQIGIWRTLKTFIGDVDTLNDARFKNKFGPNGFLLQIPADAPISTDWLYTYYSGTNTPIPIIRTEGLVLDRAQIELGLGNLGTAITLINQVHQQAGGYAAPLTIASTYTAVRDTLLKEERISTVFEGSNDRLISIRMYGLTAVADTTWPNDLHTNVLPVPASELLGRNGNYTVTCP